MLIGWYILIEYSTDIDIIDIMDFTQACSLYTSSYITVKYLNLINIFYFLK